MIRVIFVILGFSFSNISWASKCGTSAYLSHMANTVKEFEMCIDFEKAGNCEHFKTVKIQEKETVKVSFTFMCGYPSDPSIDKYWLIYREVGDSKYSIIKYSEQSIVL